MRIQVLFIYFLLLLNVILYSLEQEVVDDLGACMPNPLTNVTALLNLVAISLVKVDSCGFMGGSSLRYSTTLTGLVTTDIVIVEI